MLKCAPRNSCPTKALAKRNYMIVTCDQMESGKCFTLYLSSLIFIMHISILKVLRSHIFKKGICWHCFPRPYVSKGLCSPQEIRLYTFGNMLCRCTNRSHQGPERKYFRFWGGISDQIWDTRTWISEEKNEECLVKVYVLNMSSKWLVGLACIFFRSVWKPPLWARKSLWQLPGPAVVAQTPPRTRHRRDRQGCVPTHCAYQHRNLKFL